MGIFDRMSRVVSANFNALIDAAEDPRKSIEQTLREMDATLGEARDEVVRAVAAEKQLRAKEADMAVEIGRWERRAELAIEHSDDDLAREALKQKKRLNLERERAETLRGEARASALELKREYERMQAKVDELKATKGALAAKVAQAKQGADAPSAGPGGSAFQGFRAMEERISAVDTAVAAQREVDEVLGAARGPGGLTPDEVEARFRALESGEGAVASEAQSDVEEELSQLKRKVRVKA